MIGVDEAKRRMMAAVTGMPTEELPLSEACGRFIAADAHAPFDHPLFDNSAMDGYAFAFGAGPWRIVGEVAAGGVFPRPLAEGECVRIFTGAVMPAGADTVVMQELAERQEDMMVHRDMKLRRGGNVRCKGEQLRRGDVAVDCGRLLDPGAIGLLASVGTRRVAVSRKPRVALLIGGDEFAEGDVPAPGKIFGSNGVMLSAALRAEGIEADALHVKDDHEALASAFRTAARTHDLVISTGGVSVGDHDLVRPVLDAMGAEVLFHRVSQKPGKPMLFAKLGGTAVIGLPGNPRAVMVLFMEYVRPFLHAMQGSKTPWMHQDVSPIAHALRLRGDRAEFRAARMAGGRVHLLADEGSHMLRSLTAADVIAYIPATVRELAEGDPVEVHYIH